MGYSIGDWKNGSPFGSGNNSSALGNWFSKIFGVDTSKLGSDLWKWLNGTNVVESQYGYNSALQEDAQRFNAEEAQKDRDFQQWMATHQYQNAANDLKAAGLNPWLAVTGMNGANASGAMASSSASSVSQGRTAAQNIGDIASTAVSAAIIAKIVAKMLK